MREFYIRNFRAKKNHIQLRAYVLYTFLDVFVKIFTFFLTSFLTLAFYSQLNVCPSTLRTNS